jgi:hypothetical protein
MSTVNEIALGDRSFEVHYDRIGEDLWRASAELIDEIHHIKTSLDIGVPDLKVRDARIELIGTPLRSCAGICGREKRLIGTKTEDLGFKVFRLFLGRGGCANVYLLFGLSGPGFLNVYYLNKVKEGTMTQEAYDTMMKNDCIAHGKRFRGAP